MLRGRGKWLFVLLAALAVVPVFAGCRRKPNLVLITLDTTRADHLRCYGYPDMENPGLNRLAREGVIFDRAYSESPLTLPAHTTIMSGVAAMSHGVVDNGAYKVPDELLTLAEVLKQEGYQTAAMVSSASLHKQFNLNQGFDTWDEEDMQAQQTMGPLVAERKGDRTTAAALKWLAQKGSGPFFLWIHYYDPHAVYDPPPPYNELYAHRYDGEIAFMDAQIKKVLDRLDETGELDASLVVAVGDHGEGLGQHFENSHGFLLYEPTQHVPLIMRGPGIPPGMRVRTPVGQLDIMPTVLEALGIAVPAQVMGQSLLPLMGGEEPAEERPVLMESQAGFLHWGWSPLVAIISGKWKYIKAPKPELYDLSQDPLESRNLYAPDNKTGLQLAGRLEQLRREYSRLKFETQEAKVTEEERRQLEALGYVTGGNHGNAGLAATKNPRDMAELLPAFLHLADADFRGDFPDILRTSELILQRDPSNPEALSKRAWALVCLGRLDDALAAYQTFFKWHPDGTRNYLQVGHIHTRLSQNAKVAGDEGKWRAELALARASYEQAAAGKHPDEALYYLARIEMGTGNLPAAEKLLGRLSGFWAAIGQANYLDLTGKPDAAEENFKKGEKESGALFNLVYLQEYGQFLVGRGRKPEAAALLTKALQNDPGLSYDMAFMKLLKDTGVDPATITAPGAVPGAQNTAPADPAASRAGSGSGSGPSGATSH